MTDRILDALHTQTSHAVKAQRLTMDWSAAQQKIIEKQAQAAMAATNASLDATRDGLRALTELAVSALPAPSADAS